MKRHYELIVFDLDGTLIDSEAKILRCLTAAAADRYNRRMFNEDEPVRDFLGNPLLGETVCRLPAQAVGLSAHLIIGSPPRGGIP